MLRTRQLHTHWSPVRISRQGQCGFLICSHIITSCSVLVEFSPSEMTWAAVKVSEIVFGLEALRLGHATASEDMFISLLCTSASCHVWRCYSAERPIACNKVIQQQSWVWVRSRICWKTADINLLSEELSIDLYMHKSVQLVTIPTVCETVIKLFFSAMLDIFKKEMTNRCAIKCKTNRD